MKYHPTNPNILASGCLGFEVRVWDIAKYSCLSVLRFEFSIISLSFHPQGDYLAIGFSILYFVAIIIFINE